MLQAFEKFSTNIQQIKALSDVYTHLVSQAAFAQNESIVADILRAQWVYAVSALDKFIHDVVRIGMIRAFTGQGQRSAKFLSFEIPLSVLLEMAPSESSNAVIDESERLTAFTKRVNDKLKHLSFQDASKIADGLSYIWEENYKWQKITQQINTDTGSSQTDTNIKSELTRIVNRRNQIVHEADLSLATGEKNEISTEDISIVVDFIEHLVKAIYHILNHR